MYLLQSIRKRAILLALSCLLLSLSFYVAGQKKPPVYVTEAATFQVSELPILKNATSFPVLSAQGVYAYDLDSGVILYEKNSDAVLFPASTTKIITALVALDSYKMDQIVNTGIFSVLGSKMGLTWHEEISVRDLLYGLLVYSANDAAEVLANNYCSPGGVCGRDEFIRAMNEKAEELHALNTHFVNPAGLDAIDQVTTAKDLSRITSQAMLRADFAEIVKTKEYVAKSVDGKIIHPMKNRNELLGKVPGVLGVKTGWTENARENLVTFTNRDDKKVIIAILGSQDRFGESEELINWIYANYDWQDVTSSPELLPHNIDL